MRLPNNKAHIKLKSGSSPCPASLKQRRKGGYEALRFTIKPVLNESRGLAHAFPLLQPAGWVGCRSSPTCGAPRSERTAFTDRYAAAPGCPPPRGPAATHPSDESRSAAPPSGDSRTTGVWPPGAGRGGGGRGGEEKGRGRKPPARTKASGRKGRVRRARWQPCPRGRPRPSGAAPIRAWSATAGPFLRRRRISASRSSSAISTSRVGSAVPRRARWGGGTGPARPAGRGPGRGAARCPVRHASGRPRLWRVTERRGCAGTTAPRGGAMAGVGAGCGRGPAGRHCRTSRPPLEAGNACGNKRPFCFQPRKASGKWRKNSICSYKWLRKRSWWNCWRCRLLSERWKGRTCLVSACERSIWCWWAKGART